MQLSLIIKIFNYLIKSLKLAMLLLFIFSYQLVYGQQKIDTLNFDYSKADSIALNFPKKKYKHYTDLVAPLTEKLKIDFP